MGAVVSLRWMIVSVVIAVAVGLALTRVTQAAWAPPLAMGLVMGALIGTGRVLRRRGGKA